MTCSQCGYAACVSKKECPVCHGRGKTFDPNVTHMMWPPPPPVSQILSAQPKAITASATAKRGRWKGLFRPFSSLFLVFLPEKFQKQA